MRAAVAAVAAAVVLTAGCAIRVGEPATAPLREPSTSQLMRFQRELRAIHGELFGSDPSVIVTSQDLALSVCRVGDSGESLEDVARDIDSGGVPSDEALAVGVDIFCDGHHDAWLAAVDEARSD